MVSINCTETLMHHRLNNRNVFGKKKKKKNERLNVLLCFGGRVTRNTRGGGKGSVWEHVSVNHCRQQKKRSHQQPAVT